MSALGATWDTFRVIPARLAAAAALVGGLLWIAHAVLGGGSDPVPATLHFVGLGFILVASAIFGSIAIEDGAPSSWRPPWFDTTIASAPLLVASLASSTSRMPLMISLPGHSERIQVTSCQLRVGSNWLAVHLASELMPSWSFT